MTKHTPGPWEWRDGDDLRQARSTRDDGRYGEAVLVAAYDYDRGPYLETTDENRAILKAAPDMLEALRLVADYLMGDDEIPESIATAINDAIAKAKGTP